MPDAMLRFFSLAVSVTDMGSAPPTFKETLAQLWTKFLAFVARFEHPGAAIAANFKYDFVVEALIVGILIALCSSLLGVSLVLKRFSFIGDGLSHVAFGAMTVAAILNMKEQEMIVVLPVTVLAAVLLLRTGRKRKIAGDASLAMLSVGALGLGYLLINIFGSGNVSSDVCTTLFGAASILNISDFEFWLCIVLSVLVIIAFFFLYNRIFSVTFDEVFATATGTKASVYNTLIAIITAVIIVLAMNLVGSLLISALVIFPALSAMRVFKNFRAVVLCSMCVSVFCAAGGFLLSIPAGTPIGSTIVAVDLIVFLIFSVAGIIKKRCNTVPINKRKIAVSILLSFATFGAYLIYWKYLLVKNTRAIKNDDSSCTREMLCLVFVPFYTVYWWFTRGKLVKDYFSGLGYPVTCHENVYLIFGIYGLEIVSMAIMQKDFNTLPSAAAETADPVKAAEC